MYNITNLSRVHAGRQGETGLRKVVIDCSAWTQSYPDLSIALVAIRPGETEPYVPTGVTLSDGILTWIPDAVDTAIAGTGLLGVQGTDASEHVIKSAKTTYMVESAVDTPQGYVPSEPEESWLAHAEAVLQDMLDRLAAQSAGAITDWLEENITQETGYVIDTSLTVTGAAADAKAVGDILTPAAVDLASLTRAGIVSDDHLTVANAYLTSTGKQTGSTNYNASPFIPVKAGDVIRFGLYAGNTSSVFAFYTSNVEGVAADYVCAGLSPTRIKEDSYTCPSDGYIRYCTRKDQTTHYLYIENVLADGLKVRFDDLTTGLAATDAELASAMVVDYASASFTTGYISPSGNISAATSNAEVTSEPLYGVSKLTFTLSFEESKSMWIAVGAWSADGFIAGSRATYTGTTAALSGTFDCPDGTQYVRISFRTYDSTYALALKGHYSPVANAKKIADTNERISEATSRTSILRSLRPCYDHLFLNDYNDAITIPSESIYHVRLSRALGFNTIEANVSTTSDGVYFVHHLDNDAGQFGRYFHHVDGTTDISAVKASDVTWAWIEANVRYNSSIPKYRTRPTLLTEFLSECKKQQIVPFVTSTDQAVVELATQYMGADNFIAYGGTRTLCPTAPIYQWRRLTTKADILAFCESYGPPMIYGMSDPTVFTDAELVEIVSALHAAGYYIGVSYQDKDWHKYAGMGFDFNGTQMSVNRIASGNLYNIDAAFGFDGFNYTNATETDGVLTWSADGTFGPNVANTVHPVSMVDIEIWFEGTITLYAKGEMKSNVTYTSDGTASIFRTLPIVNGDVSLTFAVTSGTKIFDARFKASRV